MRTKPWLFDIFGAEAKSWPVVRINARDIPYLPQLRTRSSFRLLGPLTAEALRQWLRWAAGVPALPNVEHPQYPRQIPQLVDATLSLRHHLDQLERENLGQAWSPHLGVTRGEHFAMALRKMPRRLRRPDSIPEGATVNVSYSYTPGASNPIADIQAWLREAREIGSVCTAELRGFHFDDPAPRPLPRHRPYQGRHR